MAIAPSGSGSKWQWFQVAVVPSHIIAWHMAVVPSHITAWHMAVVPSSSGSKWQWFQVAVVPSHITAWHMAVVPSGSGSKSYHGMAHGNSSKWQWFQVAVVPSGTIAKVNRRWATKLSTPQMEVIRREIREAKWWHLFQNGRSSKKNWNYGHHHILPYFCEYIDIHGSCSSYWKEQWGRCQLLCL